MCSGLSARQNSELAPDENGVSSLLVTSSLLCFRKRENPDHFAVPQISHHQVGSRFAGSQKPVFMSWACTGQQPLMVPGALARPPAGILMFLSTYFRGVLLNISPVKDKLNVKLFNFISLDFTNSITHCYRPQLNADEFCFRALRFGKASTSPQSRFVKLVSQSLGVLVRK